MSNEMPKPVSASEWMRGHYQSKPIKQTKLQRKERKAAHQKGLSMAQRQDRKEIARLRAHCEELKQEIERLHGELNTLRRNEWVLK